MLSFFSTKSLRTITLTLFMLFSAFTSMAQVIPNASPQNWDTLPFKSYADYKLQNLNKSYISTGVLYDRMLPIGRIDDYKASMSMTDTTFSGHFTQSYYEMYNSAYNTSGWKTPEMLDSLLTTQGNTRHPIGIFYYKYNVVDTNALQDHLLDTLANGQFTDVPGRSRSPYFTYTSFIASPLLADEQVMEEGEHTFYIDEQFFLHNENLTITQIKIDFGDGQGEWVVNNPFSAGASRTMQPNGVVSSILKNIAGTIVGRIIVVGIDILGHTVQYGSPFKVFVKNSKPYEPLTACKGLQKWVINADASRLATINAQYPNTQLDYKGRKDTAYFYFAGNGSSCNTNVLRKPIVFIDGFDPTNSRGVQQIYEGYINKRVTRNANPNALFGDYMLSQDYDFVILDFKHGNDLLERNAMTLVKLLEQLYQTYGSTFEQEITLIGPSMGSLIAQYALAYMEHNGIPHHVKTYISFDGCHQGANVPIGLQNFVEYITKRGVLKKMDIIRNGLYNGLAARQMLAHHVSAGSQFPAPDALRVKFLQNLAAVGEYPTQCRNVAIINGANNGALNPKQTAGSDLLNISLKRKGWKSIWGLCDANICKIFNWIARTAPNTGTIKVAEMWTASPLFNLLFWVPLGKTNYDGSAAWNNSALDNAPGGMFAPILSSSDESDYVFLAKEALYLITGSNRFSFQNHLDSFTMMPSYSSADLRFINKDLYLNFKNEYLCGKTPFDYVYAPSENEEHVYVSQKSSEWFEAEIKCAKGDLPVLYNPIMNGNSVICTSGNFSIDFCKSDNRSVEWKVSNTNLAFLSGGGDQITLTKKTGNGTVTLTATISYPCTINGSNLSYTVSKVINLGLPYITQNAGSSNYNSYSTNPDVEGSGASPNQICTGPQISFPVSVAGGSAPSWSRTFADPTNTTWSQNGNTLNFYLWGNNQKATFKVTSSNICGVAQEYFPFKSIGCGGGPGDPGPCNQYVVSPNPAISNINVYVPNIPPPCDPPILSKTGETLSKRGITAVRLFDNLGNLKKQQSTAKTTQLSMNISGLTPGIYYLEISDGAFKERQKVVIQ